ncbi:MAG TPA: DUF6398 domain-containing protein [Tepidisphaeraceae bacterium]|jgi:hypothetical protein|nr:DUF6398 domain-containing protein [Tepidisphaeraceae bacterium]
MQLPPDDVATFFKLHRSLMFFVNQRLQVLPDRPANADEYSSLPPSARVKVHEALLQHQDVIQSFVDENPAGLAPDELDIVRSWRHLVRGEFLIIREMARYTVFLSTERPPVAYGVLALAQPFDVLVGPDLPLMVRTVLLPFKDKIVFDSLMSVSGISFGPGIRRGLNDDFKEAKARHGIVTSLPMSDTPMPVKMPKAKPTPKAPSREDAAGILQAIIGLIDQFCRENLNEEYASLCRKLAEKLARKRPSPLLSGSPSTWAAGIVRTVGWVNFLHDKTQTPHMRLGDIDAGFGISESSGAAKLAALRKMLKLHQLDPNWTLPSKLDDNPLAWMIEVNGFIMDVRRAPRQVQELALEKGLIPYLPGDRQMGD